MSKKKSGKIEGMEMEIAPLRSLDDFLLDSARFQIPNFRDFDKWENRIVNNLLYYQTNYFVLGMVIFTVVGILHPLQLLSGIASISIAFGIFYYFANVSASATRFKKNYPIVGVILILVAAHFGVYMLGSLLIFMLGILLPIAVTFVHSSMRLRNIKNKLVNRMENVGLKKTPMGVFLESLGKLEYRLQQRAFIEEIKTQFISQE